jgi:hypothetical protein
MAAISPESKIKNPADAAQDRLNNRAHGGVQAARRVHGDQNQIGVLVVRFRDSTDEVFGKDRLDFAVDVKLDNFGSGRRRLRGRGLGYKGVIEAENRAANHTRKQNQQAK